MSQVDRDLRVKRFEAKVKAEKVASIEIVVRDLEAMVAALAEQIAREEQRTKVVDAARPNYSIIALAATMRRNKLIVSLADLKTLLEAAKREHVAAEADLSYLEIALGVPAESRRGTDLLQMSAPSAKRDGRSTAA